MPRVPDQPLARGPRVARRAGLAVLLALAVLHGPVHARGPEPYHSRYLRGLYLRVAAGLGYGVAREGTSSTHLDGLALQLDVALGGIVAPGLAVSAEFFGNAVFKPRVMSGSHRRAANRPKVLFDALALGVTYTFLPSDVFVGAALGPSIALIDRGPIGGDTHFLDGGWGVAFQVLVGKEWRIASHTGLGAAAHFMVSHHPSVRDGDPWNILQIGASLAIIYN